MDKKTAMERLFSALIETGAEFSYDDGAVTVGDITFTCREDYIVVSMEQATSYFRYKTLCYISGRCGQLSIADSHVGVFGTYKVGREMYLVDESEDEDQAVIDELEASSLSYDWDDDDDDDDDDELIDAFLAADIEALS